MTRILIADDHPIILSGVEAVLKDTPYDIVGSARDGASALKLVDEKRPDILVLDERMPELSGIEVLRALRQRGDRRPVVLLTADLSDRKLLDAVELGVEGIVLKENAHSHLLSCLDEVARGGRWLEPGLVQQALDLKLRESMATPNSFSTLSPREGTIVALVAQGLRNRDIAAQLGLTEGTIKVYLNRIYEKLQVTNRTELAILVRENNDRLIKD
ncbi:response regulator transcription factor [Sphingosinicella sp. LHD-64]|uniref:response regulator transcription factor n=1 Tax=Sphingosinicella sp. LHD-64 TaxID=3072139 RepID=UPI00280ECCA2|nr:response regulator transcription factor [Sphingosinicella sp. LHD-64]MDQ8755890.1 response regulator transcription factor [Sphingosinicella sp. LHD-64]